MQRHEEWLGSTHGLNDFGPSWSGRVQSLPHAGDTQHSEGHKSPKLQNPEKDLQGDLCRSRRRDGRKVRQQHILHGVVLSAVSCKSAGTQWLLGLQSS